jgi:DtxR family Mn-dependent transcriptional regulator
MLTPSQQDYLEAVLTLSEKRRVVRVTDVAQALKVRLPTVTRAVKQLRKRGYLRQERRGPVRITERGRAVASALRHLHGDLVHFLVEVLGVPRRVARRDAGRMEHSLSSASAQRLHEFLIYLTGQKRTFRQRLNGFKRASARRARLFERLTASRAFGWRA